MATIKDVAKAAGVSVATVSRVINKSPKASQASIDSVTKAMQELVIAPMLLREHWLAKAPIRWACWFLMCQTHFSAP